MRVRFSDPQGPRWLEAVAVLPAVALALFAMFSRAVVGESAAALVAAAAVLAHVPKLLFLRQRRMRSAELSCGAGQVVVRGARSRNQRIRAKEITGCSTARTSDGILVTLEHAGRDQPVSIEVGTEEEADQIRRALGIGHAGYGLVGWSTTLSTQRKTTVLGLVLAVPACLLYAEATALAWFLAVLSVAFGAFTLSGGSGIRTIALRAEGLQLPAPWGWHTVPYDELLGIDVVPYGLRFRTVGGDLDARIGWGALGAHERESLLLQVEAAAARARGQGRPKTPLSERLDVLRRGRESVGEWVTRLDTAGKLLEGAGAGYRDASLDANDLWSIFEDPEAPPDLRAAAGRVLRHVPRAEVKTRIDAAIAAVRDEDTNRRLRVAVGPNPDAASRELAWLEEEERTRLRRRA